MTMTPALIEQLGDELYQALTQRQTLEPLTNLHADITIEDAYARSMGGLGASGAVFFDIKNAGTEADHHADRP